MNPDYPEPLIDKAFLLLSAREDLWNALEDLLEVTIRLVSDFPELVISYTLRGLCLSKMNRHTDAVDDLTIAIKINSKIPQLSLLMGFSLVAGLNAVVVEVQ